MSNQILQVDENMLETKLDRLMSRKGEELLNAMLDAEADEITGAARYERASGRRAYRAGHYERNLTVKAGTMTLRVPKLKGAVFESAVIERYRRREQSVEEALIDMYLAGVSTRQVDDISRLLWGERMPSQTLSDKLKRVYEDIDQWRNRPLAAHSYPYLFVDGVWHKRTWGGSVENVSVLVAIGVDDTGHREVIGVAEGMKEDKASWEQFVRSMIERGLRGVRLVVGDRCAGLVSTVNSMLPDARYQRCMVHFMRNVLSKVSHKHAAWAASALKAVFAMESRQAALEKAEQVATEMESKGLKAAASCLREGISETTTYLLDDYPVEHRRRIRTNNMKDRKHVPSSTFLATPYSRVGLNEREAKAAGLDYVVKRLPVAAVPKTRVMRRPDGLMKAIVERNTGRILGAMLLSVESHEVINIVKLAMDLDAPASTLRDMAFTHPTIAEALNDLFA
ncbi:IS256 family transposase [Bifidobacterium longum]|uniref:IS256 family transposase n=1 Tax=Bifidobacterium longum TaxID=216816 RepID=A0A6A2SRR9_BIFLN|nr:IS256 family transposase [Bifidobacterium longum]KAB7019212.1 IS256 family transposase [Bifidobacterium longum]KAB7020195.1 IS256 family transposase [Bifidobacterium longum]KAB7024327.1 IS256 family transposase [Bifidobacterium longum]KAB7025092.1 IS256 family transposase [Bifidobacterium longum]